MADQIDLNTATTIFDEGWRQGSVFSPGADIEVPDNCKLAADELLIVCTQDCTVVSSRFGTDPVVEAMVIRPVSGYNSRSPEAKGKNSRKLHLKLDMNSPVDAIECDINRRFMFPRRDLLKCQRQGGYALSLQSCRALADWIARYYTRIALPNEWVSRARNGLISGLRNILEQPLSGHPLHEQVIGIYVQWAPNDELTAGEQYEMEMLFLCEKQEAQDVLDNELSQFLQPFLLPSGKDGIIITGYRVQLLSETFLADLNGFVRLSEWDYFTELGENVTQPF